MRLSQLSARCHMVAHANGDNDTIHIQPCQHLRSSRVVPCQAAKALNPADATSDHSTARQQDNVSCHVFPPDDPQLHPVVPRRRFRVLAWIALRDTGQYDRFPCHAACFAPENAAEPVLALWAPVPLTASRCPSGSTAIWTLLPCDLSQELRPAQPRAGGARV